MENKQIFVCYDSLTLTFDPNDLEKVYSSEECLGDLVT